MRTLTIRKLPEDVIDRLKAVARLKAHSMAQEFLELLETKFATRSAVGARIRERWKDLPKATPKQVKTWRQTGRH